MQDTHLLEPDLSSVNLIWPKSYLSGKSTSSRGVTVLLNNNFDYEVLDINQDKEGNILQLLIKYDSLTTNLINIYAPKRDNPIFLDKVITE